MNEQQSLFDLPVVTTPDGAIGSPPVDWRRRTEMIAYWRKYNGWTLYDCALEFHLSISRLQAQAAAAGYPIPSDPKPETTIRHCSAEECGRLIRVTRHGRLCTDCGGIGKLIRPDGSSR